MRQLLLSVGKRWPVSGIVALVIGLNVYWSVLLEQFGAHFERVAGAPLLDLENVESILSASEAAALIARYSQEGQTLYWQFFVLDTLFPPIVFASFALLWVAMLKNVTAPLVVRFLNSPLLLIPLGVGFFDWWENLAFVTAVTTPAAATLPLLQIGLAFVWLKAICLFSTFGLTLGVILVRILLAIRPRLGQLVAPSSEIPG